MTMIKKNIIAVALAITAIVGTMGVAPATSEAAVVINTQGILDSGIYTETMAVEDGVAYTGLIVDCRGMGVAQCVNTKLGFLLGDVSEHRFAYYSLNENRQLSSTMISSPVGYANSFYDAVSLARAGSNPLVVRPVAAATIETPRANTPILDSSVRRAIATAIRTRDFMREGNIVFIIDDKVRKNSIAMRDGVNIEVGDDGTLSISNEGYKDAYKGNLNDYMNYMPSKFGEL